MLIKQLLTSNNNNGLLAFGAQVTGKCFLRITTVSALFMLVVHMIKIIKLQTIWQNTVKIS